MQRFEKQNSYKTNIRWGTGRISKNEIIARSTNTTSKKIRKNSFLINYSMAPHRT